MRLGLNPDLRYVFTFFRADPRLKGLDLLLDAWAALRRKGCTEWVAA